MHLLMDHRLQVGLGQLHGLLHKSAGDDIPHRDREDDDLNFMASRPSWLPA